MVAGAVGKRVDEARHAAADLGPVAGGGPRQACGVGDRRNVEEQIRGSAKRRVRDHRVSERRFGEDVADADAPLLQLHQRASRPPREIEPDRLAGRSERGVTERKPKRFADDLRRRRRAEKLAATARRRTRAAPEIRRLLQRDVAVHESNADRLHAAGILGFDRQQRHAARHEHTRQIAGCGERHHHRRQPLVARGNPEHPATRGERPDQPTEDRRRVVAIRQAVEHRRRALRAPIARVGTRGCERNRPGAREFSGRRFHQQPDFPVTGVISKGDRRSIRCADSTVGREHQELAPSECRGVPAHAGVLRPAEEIARRAFPEHLRGQWQRAGRDRPRVSRRRRALDPACRRGWRPRRNDIRARESFQVAASTIEVRPRWCKTSNLKVRARSVV